MRKYNWKKILVSTLWVIAGIGAIILLGAAIRKKNQKVCTDIRIEITGVDKQMFIDEKDVLDLLNSTGKITGIPEALLNLRQMETTVEKNAWVRNAEMFIDNNQVLQVRIEERQPVARVFSINGNSFYVDSGSLRLPLSEKLSARVPIFTGFPSDKPVLAKPDSALLDDIISVGKFISSDSFWSAQTAQINITPQGNFELVPVVGDHIVELGDAEDLDQKFKRLYTFYKQAWLQNGINTYEKLDVRYSNQVVAVRKGTAKAMMDSSRAHQLIAEMQMQRAIDSANASAAVETNPKPVKDSGAAKKIVPVVKVPSKPGAATNSSVITNNKANKKPLTNGKNKRVKKTVRKKTVKKPKAVMK